MQLHIYLKKKTNTSMQLHIYLTKQLQYITSVAHRGPLICSVNTFDILLGLPFY